MNMQIHSAEEQLKLGADMAATATEMDTLAQYAFTDDEIISLLWLRQWYQNGGSDRTEVIRHLEFLKLLVLTGRMEL